MTVDSIKNTIGKAAADLVQEGMAVGLGTGSTARHFIHHLAGRCRQGLNITAIATSRASESQAREEGIPLENPETVIQLDLTVDGADELDPQKNMIKGGGGALLREKIAANAAAEMVVMVDDSKLVNKLGAFPLPVEVIPYGLASTLKALRDKGLNPILRLRGEKPFVTEGGHYIADLHLGSLIADPHKLDQELKALPGVVETGLFLNLAGRVIIGRKDGSIEIRP